MCDKWRVGLLRLISADRPPFIYTDSNLSLAVEPFMLYSKRWHLRTISLPMLKVLQSPAVETELVFVINMFLINFPSRLQTLHPSIFRCICISWLHIVAIEHETSTARLSHRTKIFFSLNMHKLQAVPASFTVNLTSYLSIL
jgi:hypothetical protein